jgi:hypothetical protein
MKLGSDARAGGLADNWHVALVPVWLASYLQEPETRALARLSLFEAHFDKAAALHMCAAAPRLASPSEANRTEEAQQLLDDLQHAHLLLPALGNRFGMHLMVRHYSQRRRMESSDEEQHASERLFISWVLGSVPGQLAQVQAELWQAHPASADSNSAAAELLAAELRNVRTLCNLLSMEQHADLLTDATRMAQMGTLTWALEACGRASDAAMLRQLCPQRGNGRRRRQTSNRPRPGGKGAHTHGEQCASASGQLSTLVGSNANERHVQLNKEDPDSKSSAAAAATGTGDFSVAAKLHAEDLEARLHFLGVEHLDTLASMGKFTGALEGMMGQHSAAISFATIANALTPLNRALAAVNGANGRGGKLVSACQALLHGGLSPQHPVLAAAVHEEILEIMQRQLPVEHSSTLKAMISLARSKQQAGKHADAVRRWGQVLEVRQRLLGPAHPDTLRQHGRAGWRAGGSWAQPKGRASEEGSPVGGAKGAGSLGIIVWPLDMHVALPAGVHLR